MSVFLGSGLLLIASLFGTAAVAGTLVAAIGANISGVSYYYGRCMSDMLLNLFGMKMAGVFIFWACTIGLWTEILPCWLVYSSYACGWLLLLVIAEWKSITLCELTRSSL